MMKKVLITIMVGIISTTSLMARDWSSIKKSGVLKVSLRESSAITYTEKDGDGFAYDMAKDFAKFHNLKMEFIVVPTFATLWRKDGEILLKNSKIATPDIYKKVDIVADILTITPRREELIKMTPYLDNVELLFGRHSLSIKSYKDLIGKRVLTWENMSFYKILKSQMDEKNIPYKITNIDEDKNKIVLKNPKIDKSVVNIFLLKINSKISSKTAYHYTIGDKPYTDIGINDGVSVIASLFANSYYRENLKPLIPAQKNKTKLSWGSQKENKILNQKIKEFIEYDKKSGNFSKRFNKYLGMTLAEYYELINMME